MLTSQAVEGLEQPGHLCRVQAQAGVAHAQLQLAVVQPARAHHHAAALHVVLDGVGQQVGQHLLEAGFVGHHHTGVGVQLHLQRHRAPGRRRAQHCHALVDQRLQGHR